MENSSRFQPLDVDRFIEANENNNTLKKTVSHLKLLQEFLEKSGELRVIQAIPPSELDDYLSNFIISVRTKDGKEYEPGSLRGMISSFDRHMRKRAYRVAIMSSSPEFAKTRKIYALKAKQRDLKSQGKGSNPMKADPITDQEIEILTVP